MNRLIFSLSILLIAITSNAQLTITGIIKQTNNSPIPGATVMLKGTYDGAVTDNNGYYQIKTSQKGPQSLLVRYVGYDSQEVKIEILDTNIALDFTLKESFNELTAVTITAGAFEAGDKKKAVKLSALDMITVPGAQGNIVGAMQSLPGTTTNGESGKLFVRGGSSAESQIYVDGTIVPVAYNASAPNTSVRSKFNPFLFEGTVFSSGGFSAEYGQALSSVLLLETKGMQTQDQLDISILSVGLGLAGTKKWKKGAITVSLDHNNLKPYIALVPQNIDWVNTPKANNLGVNLRQKTKKGLFKFYSTYNDSYFELNREDLNNKYTLTNYNLKNHNYFANASWKGKLNKNWLLKIGGAFTYNTDLVTVNTLKFNEELFAGHIKAVGTRKISKKIKLLVGIESFIKEYKETYNTPEQKILQQFKDVTSGAFIESNIYLSKKLVARIGIRSEYAQHIDKFNVSPRVSMAYQTTKNSQISFASGRFHQQAENKFLLYADQLDFQYADQYMFNYQWSSNKRTIRAELYLKEYDNLVKFDDAPFYLPSHYNNNGKGYAKGVDFFYRDKKTIKNGDFWISYSILDTERDEQNSNGYAVPTYASKHNLSIVYKHWIRQWRSLIGASFNYSSPRFYNDPNKETFNSEKMKAYQALNINWSFLYRENVIFYGSVSNVLGYQQSFGYEFASTPNAEGIYLQRSIEPPSPRFFILGCFITLSKGGDQNQLDKIN